LRAALRWWIDSQHVERAVNQAVLLFWVWFFGYCKCRDKSGTLVQVLPG
jgi:hypothetical protein